MSENSAKTPDSIVVKIAETPQEIEAAQRLRYAVFYEEYGAVASPEMARVAMDFDDYDEFADHLIVIDTSNGGNEVIGTYRLLRRERAEKVGQFYSASEYDITPLVQSKYKILELGRSCVRHDYRTKAILQTLWQGISDYISDHEVDILFGCASLHSTDIKSISKPLSYLHHYHLAPEKLRPRALKGRYINMNIVPEEDLDVRRVFAELPPLIKGYLRVGASIGDGAVIDEEFNTTDVFIVMQTHLLADRYRKHYERRRSNTALSEDPVLSEKADNIVDFQKTSQS